MAIDRQELIARLESSRDLSGLDLAGADLSRLDLRGINLSRADLSAADLRWAVLEGADLDSAVLRRADARWAVLRGAGLRNADLVRANFAWSDLSGADLTGADVDGANLDSAILTDALLPVPQRGRSRPPRAPVPQAAAGAGALWPGVRRPSASVVAVALSGILALLWLWGWLFNKTYYRDGFGIESDSLGQLADAGNILTGLLRVLPLELLALIVVPLVLLGLAFAVALLAALPLLLAYVTQRALLDVVRPRARPFVIGSLFVALFVLFLLILPPALSFARDTSEQAAPSSGALHVVFAVFAAGGLWSRLGVLAVLALAGVLAWLAWRWLSHWLSGWQMPLSWRLRYPMLDSAVEMLRESRLTARNEPLAETERRYAAAAAGGLLLLLGFLMSGAGRVYAEEDMCDGGALARGQLYLNSVPGADQRLLCERMVATTEEAYYVFFPGQTTSADSGGGSHPTAYVSAVQQAQNVFWVEATGDHDCATCKSSAEVKQSATMRVVIDPNEIETEGQVVERTGDLVNLDAPEGALASVRLGPGTSYALNGAPATESAVQTGSFIRAAGNQAADGPILEARLVEVQSRPQAAPPPPLAVDLGDPAAIVISGAGFVAGNSVAIGLGPTGASGPQVPLVPTALVGSDGTFSVVVSYSPTMPTGPQWQVIARDSVSGQYAAGPWLSAAPPPTATPRPSPSPAVVNEETPGAGGTPGAGTPGAEGTGTPEPEASNTALPTPMLPPGAAGAGDCTPDGNEPDWPRGYEKEIYVSFAEGNAIDHSFCGRGARPRNDIDLSYFYVKAWRWYRVATSDLAPGVDTVMAVGDLSASTRCQPAGCWNDDRAALTYESEIVFQAVEDGRAMITVDNRGGAYGTDATYKLTVTEFEPQPTVTPTVSATPSVTPTPTVTATGLPFVDLYEPNDRCSQAYSPLVLNQVYEATIDTRTDEDWFKTQPLPAGTYRLEMQPPAAKDYDVTLHSFANQSRNECPVLTNEGRTAGEGRRETIRFTVTDASAGTEFGIKVFSRYASIYYSEHYPYLLLLVAESTATAGPSASPSLPATGTRTPTLPPPTPDSALFPRPTVTPTFTPPSVAAAPAPRP